MLAYRSPDRAGLEEIWPVVRAGFLERFRYKVAAALAAPVLVVWVVDELAFGGVGLGWWVAPVLAVLGWLVGGPALRLSMRSSGPGEVSWWQWTVPAGTAVLRVDGGDEEWRVSFLTASPNGRGLGRDLVRQVVALAPTGTRVHGNARPPVAERYEKWGATKSVRRVCGIRLPRWSVWLCGYSVNFKGNATVSG